MVTSNDFEAQAHAAWENNQETLAFQLFSQAVSAGLENCMLNLGYFYDEGLGTKQDKEKAMYWYKRAYRKGSSAARQTLQLCTENAHIFGWLCSGSGSQPISAMEIPPSSSQSSI